MHVIVADQEFMPTIMKEFFSSLKTDSPLPIIPTLAVGHALKGLSVSMMSFYKCYFDPMLNAIGIKVDWPEYKVLCKGSVIRDTNRLVINFTEMLAYAAALQYLAEVGNEQRIGFELGETSTPNVILCTYFASTTSDAEDPTACSK